MNRNIKNLRRLSGAAIAKLESVLKHGARAIRDVVLDENLNSLAERAQVVDPGEVARVYEALGSLNGAHDVALALGKAYRDACCPGFNLRDWYQACGLDQSGNLYDDLFADEVDEDSARP